MNNEEINSKLTELENKRVAIVQQQANLQVEAIKINTEIAQLRRQYKFEGYQKTRILRLSSDAKILVIQMKGNKCSKLNCKSKKLTVHHIKPLSHGGTNDLDNLEVLCEKHHTELHRV